MGSVSSSSFLFMFKKSNLVKGWLTSILGAAILLGTFYMIFFQDMRWVWEGIAGMSMGTVLLFAPRTIEKKFSDIIGAMGGGFLGLGNSESSTKPDNPDN